MLIQKHFPFLKSIHLCLLSEDSVESTEPTENIPLKKITHSNIGVSVIFSYLQYIKTMIPNSLPISLSPHLHLPIWQWGKEYKICFKSCIPKDIFSKNWPISNGLISYSYLRILICWMKSKPHVRDDIKLKSEGPQHANRRLQSYPTYFSSHIYAQKGQCSHIWTFWTVACTYNIWRNACRGAKIFKKICSF